MTKARFLCSLSCAKSRLVAAPILGWRVDLHSGLFLLQIDSADLYAEPLPYRSIGTTQRCAGGGRRFALPSLQSGDETVCLALPIPAGLFLPATPPLVSDGCAPLKRSFDKAAKGLCPDRAAQGVSPGFRAALVQPSAALRPFRPSCASTARLGDPPPLAPCYPRLRQGAFGISWKCQRTNPKPEDSGP